MGREIASGGNLRSQNGTSAVEATSASGAPSIAHAMAHVGSSPGRGTASAKRSVGKLRARSATRTWCVARVRTAPWYRGQYLLNW